MVSRALLNCRAISSPSKTYRSGWVLMQEQLHLSWSMHRKMFVGSRKQVVCSTRCYGGCFRDFIFLLSDYHILESLINLNTIRYFLCILAKISASYDYFISRGFFFRKIPAWANLSEKGSNSRVLSIEGMPHKKCDIEVTVIV